MSSLAHLCVVVVLQYVSRLFAFGIQHCCFSLYGVMYILSFLYVQFWLKLSVELVRGNALSGISLQAWVGYRWLHTYVDKARSLSHVAAPCQSKLVWVSKQSEALAGQQFQKPTCHIGSCSTWGHRPQVVELGPGFQPRVCQGRVPVYNWRRPLAGLQLKASLRATDLLQQCIPFTAGVLRTRK